MAVSEFKVDRSIREQEAEGMVILSGSLEAEPLRVQVSNEIWHLVLDHFQVGTDTGPADPPPKAYDAIEQIGDLIISRRGPPLYGVLMISLG